MTTRPLADGMIDGHRIACFRRHDSLWEAHAVDLIVSAYGETMNEALTDLRGAIAKAKENKCHVNANTTE